VSGTEKPQLQVLQTLLTAARMVSLKNVPKDDKIDYNILVQQVQNISIKNICFL
jgi:hypothetical protein